MQRARPASTRCSGDHASSSGSGEPPSPLRAVPSRSTETAYENVFASVATKATYTHPMSLAILGVTGYTGRLVLDEARRAGLPVRLVGRRHDALEALATPERRCASPTPATRARSAPPSPAPTSSRRSPGRSSSSASRPSGGDRRGAHYLDTRASRNGSVSSTRRSGPGRLCSPHSGSTTSRAISPPVSPRRRSKDRARRARRRLFGQERRHEQGNATNDRRIHGAAAGRLAGRQARPLRFGATTRSVRFPFGERDGCRVGREPSRSPCRGTPRCRTSARIIRAPAIAAKAGAPGTARGAVRPRRVPVRPLRAGGGIAGR